MEDSNKYAKIDFKAKVKPIKQLNPEFTLVKIMVCGAGKNRNMTYMSKENIEKFAKESLAYIPVVGHIIHGVNNNTGEEMSWMGGHDSEINWEDWTIKDLTVPYGVVCDSDEFEWETVNEYGEDVEYLVANAILWTGRYPELLDCIYSEDYWFSESMEIEIDQFRKLNEDSNYTELLNWHFSALCLLGKADDGSTTGHNDKEQMHTEPCFISASVVPIEYSKTEFSELMNEMKDKLSFALKDQHSEDSEQFAAIEEFDIKNNNEMIGGNQVTKKDEIAKKFGKDISELDFSVEDMTDEEFENKMEELFGEKKTESLAFSATYNQRREALRNALEPIIVKDEEEKYIEETYYYVQDFDDNYVYVEVDHWNENGDYDCKHGRFAYVFDDEKIEVTIAGTFEEMILMWLTLDEKAKIDKERNEYEEKYSTLEEEFANYKEAYSTPNTEVAELKEYKLNKESEERKIAENAVFTKYEENIGETEEFASLKENAGTYAIDALEKECLYIVGKYAIANKPENKETKPFKFSLGGEQAVKIETDPYGGLMTKYNKKKVEVK